MIDTHGVKIKQKAYDALKQEQHDGDSLSEVILKLITEVRDLRSQPGNTISTSPPLPDDFEVAVVKSDPSLKPMNFDPDGDDLEF